MSLLIHPVYRVNPISYSKGIIQQYINKFPSLYTLNWSSFSNQSEDYDCIRNKDTYCQTNSETNSSLSLFFQQYLIKLKGVSIFSCFSHNCLYNFDIYGSQLANHNDDQNISDSEKWILLCEVRKDKHFFHNKYGYAECPSKAYFKSFKFVQRGTNMDGSEILTFRFLDFFGDMILDIPSIYTFYNFPLTNLHLFLFLLCFH